jgi:hypothetical protein
VPIDQEIGSRGWELRRFLEAISDRLGEDPARRTEPDLLIDFGAHGHFLIEVKHRSKTSLQDVWYANWDRYFPGDSPLTYAAAIRASGCYELARNWRFGLELAAENNRPFMLACLGPDSLFRGDGEIELSRFEKCLPTDGIAGFQRIGWNALLGAISDPPEWLIQHFEARGYWFGDGT